MMKSLEIAARSTSLETRLKILAATRGVFSRNGTRGTTTREIAEVAGVNEATLFRHFGSKTAMIGAMREQYCRYAELENVMATLDGDIVADLRAVGRVLLRGMLEVRDLITISLAEETLDPRSVDSAWRAPGRVREQLFTYMSARVSDGTLQGDPAQNSRAFVGSIFAYVVARKLWDSEVPDEGQIDYFVDLFLYGTRRNDHRSQD